MRKLMAMLLCLTLLSASALGAFAETTPAYPGPYVVMSAGQSADAEMIKVMLTKLKVEDYTLNTLVTAEEVVKYKTLIVAVGGSSKGLGAAGIDANQELERVDAVLTAAKDAGVKIIALHIGGSARRGELSDKFIEPCISKADAGIVVAEGNADGLFDKLAETYGITITQADKIASVIAPLGELLAK
ncbi:MAG: DUF6305 family protein [Clostridia bacterium]